MKQLRWGVLGTGNIVAKGGQGIQQADYSEWVGVAGRTAENSRRCASQFGVPKAYDGYRELLADPEIDAVYIALLNHIHKEWAIEAIRSGKHVLMEKPFALNAQDAGEIVEEAIRHGVHVEEAFVTRHQEGHRFAQQAVMKGEIGEPVFFNGRFTLQLREDSTRLKAEWGGGALYDIGCYLVNWSRKQFREEPEWAEARFQRQGQGDIDRRFAGMLAFPGGGTAQLQAAFDMPYGCGYELLGTRGSVALWQYSDASTLTLQVTVNGEQHNFTTDRVTPFRLQAEAFARQVLEGRCTADGGQDIMAQARTMDALFASDAGRRRLV
ncbi:gfo/Idh/MocA family oxidoreductase [Paenibacillaceae bacterium]|nr:gfo/Idh/MocA family oxidoreductase [Paenibacillaceae bacterium]